MEKEITDLKKLLVTTAAEHNFNFQHSEVLALSQKLDILILKFLKKI
ncbi:aspartyl-phosphate phosphatase Spo0E family protein [Aneurinibacillus sp. Ricciae_BoGa-3]|nr:aspartyl-phosphate phosphatase Spo0E family protein [Aneurinibacillus sp. Ricciae_BoGa-3]WCK54908.1 aspartyl-phosphate phosphatase Spo0E family protein [Aneurinibacillus sp. Ricciae_BoGa-3]